MSIADARSGFELTAKSRPVVDRSLGPPAKSEGVCRYPDPHAEEKTAASRSVAMTISFLGIVTSRPFSALMPNSQTKVLQLNGLFFLSLGDTHGQMAVRRACQ